MWADPDTIPQRRSTEATLGLVEIRSHVWMDVVWINVSGDADPFEEAHAALLQRWREFDHPVYHGGTDSRFVLDVNCNWKLAVENYCESYHLPWVHPGTEFVFPAGRSLPYRRSRAIFGAGDFSNIDRSSQMTARLSLTFRVSPIRGILRQNTSPFIRTCCWVFIAITPLPFFWCRQAPDRTLEQIHIYYPSPETDAALRKKERGPMERGVCRGHPCGRRDATRSLRPKV